METNFNQIVGYIKANADTSSVQGDSHVYRYTLEQTPDRVFTRLAEVIDPKTGEASLFLTTMKDDRVIDSRKVDPNDERLLGYISNLARKRIIVQALSNVFVDEVDISQIHLTGPDIKIETRKTSIAPVEFQDIKIRDKNDEVWNYGLNSLKPYDIPDDIMAAFCKQFLTDVQREKTLAGLAAFRRPELKALSDDLKYIMPGDPLDMRENLPKIVGEIFEKSQNSVILTEMPDRKQLRLCYGNDENIVSLVVVKDDCNYDERFENIDFKKDISFQYEDKDFTTGETKTRSLSDLSDEEISNIYKHVTNDLHARGVIDRDAYERIREKWARLSDMATYNAYEKYVVALNSNLTDKRVKATVIPMLNEIFGTGVHRRSSGMCPQVFAGAVGRNDLAMFYDSKHYKTPVYLTRSQCRELGLKPKKPLMYIVEEYRIVDMEGKNTGLGHSDYLAMTKEERKLFKVEKLTNNGYAYNIDNTDFAKKFPETYRQLTEITRAEFSSEDLKSVFEQAVAKTAELMPNNRLFVEYAASRMFEVRYGKSPAIEFSAAKMKELRSEILNNYEMQDSKLDMGLRLASGIVNMTADKLGLSTKPHVDIREMLKQNKEILNLGK